MADQDTGFGAVEPASSMPGWYPELGSVSRHISIGRRRAVRAANQELVLTYWQVGREILERQTYEGYGTQVVNRLSNDLKHAFPESTGFSPRNLRYMRALAAAWLLAVEGHQGLRLRSRLCSAALHNCPGATTSTCSTSSTDTDSRLWNAAQAVKQGWSSDVLAWQIETKLRERRQSDHQLRYRSQPSSPTSRNRRPRTRTCSTSSAQRNRGWSATSSASCSSNVSEFLLELGQGFALVGRQVPLTIGGDEFWCDLLFYHLRLRRYVVVELKAGAFKAEIVGQLGMYLAAVTTYSLATTRSRRGADDRDAALQDQELGRGRVRSAATPLPSAWPSGLLPCRTGFHTDLGADLPCIGTLKAELSHLPLDGADR